MLTLTRLDARDNPSTVASAVPPELWQQLAADVRVLAAGTVAPSQESVQTLALTVQTAAADGAITVREKAAITAAANAVLVSANVPPAEVQAVVADVAAIVAAYRGA